MIREERSRTYSRFLDGIYFIRTIMTKIWRHIFSQEWYESECIMESLEIPPLLLNKTNLSRIGTPQKLISNRKRGRPKLTHKEKRTSVSIRKLRQRLLDSKKQQFYFEENSVEEEERICEKLLFLIEKK